MPQVDHSWLKVAHNFAQLAFRFSPAESKGSIRSLFHQRHHRHQLLLHRWKAMHRAEGSGDTICLCELVHSCACAGICWHTWVGGLSECVRCHYNIIGATELHHSCCFPRSPAMLRAESNTIPQTTSISTYPVMISPTLSRCSGTGCLPPVVAWPSRAGGGLTAIDQRDPVAMSRIKSCILCMCSVRIHMYVYICIYVYVYQYVHTYVYIYVDVDVNVDVDVDVDAYLYVCLSVSVNEYVYL